MALSAMPRPRTQVVKVWELEVYEINLLKRWQSMNFLRRELAPISPQGWSEIDSVAKKALAANLSGRKFVDVDGPHGLDYASVPLGSLTMPEKQDGATVRYGVHQVLPLVETDRKSTRLNSSHLGI